MIAWVSSCSPPRKACNPTAQSSVPPSVSDGADISGLYCRPFKAKTTLGGSQKTLAGEKGMLGSIPALLLCCVSSGGSQQLSGLLGNSRGGHCERN